METQYFPLKFFCKPKTASPAGCGGAGQLRLQGDHFLKSKKIKNCLPKQAFNLKTKNKNETKKPNKTKQNPSCFSDSEIQRKTMGHFLLFPCRQRQALVFQYEENASPWVTCDLWHGILEEGQYPIRTDQSCQTWKSVAQQWADYCEHWFCTFFVCHILRYPAIFVIEWNSRLDQFP